MLQNKKELAKIIYCFKEMNWLKRIKAVGVILFAAALVWGGIYLVALAGYISGT